MQINSNILSQLARSREGELRASAKRDSAAQALPRFARAQDSSAGRGSSAVARPGGVVARLVASRASR